MMLSLLSILRGRMYGPLFTKLYKLNISKWQKQNINVNFSLASFL